jgi:hypothetical protein
MSCISEEEVIVMKRLVKKFLFYAICMCFCLVFYISSTSITFTIYYNPLPSQINDFSKKFVVSSTTTMSLDKIR